MIGITHIFFRTGVTIGMSCLLCGDVGNHRNRHGESKGENVLCQTAASLTLNTTLTNLMTLANYNF